MNNFCNKLENKEFGDKIAKSVGLNIKNRDIPGIEIITEMWFSKGKRLNPGISFIVTKEQGYDIFTAWCHKQKEPKIIQKLYNPINIMIERTGYTGPIAMVVTISDEDNKAYFDRFETHLNRSRTYCLQQILKISIQKFLEKVVNNDLSIKDFDINKFGYSVTVKGIVLNKIEQYAEFSAGIKEYDKLAKKGWFFQPRRPKSEFKGIGVPKGRNNQSCANAGRPVMAI